MMYPKWNSYFHIFIFLFIYFPSKVYTIYTSYVYILKQLTFG